MSNPLEVFVSSTQNELRDLRAVVGDFLEGLGIIAHLSESDGFPHLAGEKPYVTCLRTLEQSQLVIGVLEHEYGTPYSDWTPYKQYSGLSPIHAEFRHALAFGKKLLLYVHESTLNAYNQWKSDPDGYANLNAKGPDLSALKLYDEMMTASVPPWRVPFRDASGILSSLKKNLINEIYTSLREQEQKNRGEAAYLARQILEADPEIQRQVQEAVNPDIVSDIERLKTERLMLEQRLASTEKDSQSSIDALKEEKRTVERSLEALQEQVQTQQIVIAMSAVKDTGWLHAIRTQLMPQQPGRTPFHNAAEVALRGYHASNSPKQPHLSAVTWSSLPYTENGLHRGYRAGLVFTGRDFAPGVTWAERWQLGPDSMRNNVLWRLPNIYFGDYLEVSTHDDPDEGPVGHLNSEFAVRNPEGQISEWVAFSYPFDYSKLEQTIKSNSELGQGLAAKPFVSIIGEPG